MSRITYDDLQLEHPNLQGAWSAITKWRTINPHSRVIVPAVVAKKYLTVTAEEMMEALRELVRSHLYELKYAVKSPLGQVLTSQLYSSPKDIPPTVKGGYDFDIQTNDAEIVPVYIESE